MWIALASLLLGTAEAKKDKDAGVTIEITVMDMEGKPVPTAVVKHEKESDPSRVNELTGVWQAKEVFDAEGAEFPFKPGNIEQFSISAPGYMTQVVKYDVRRRHNNIEIKLDKMEIEQEDAEDIITPFGRDKERIDGGPGGSN